MNNAGVMDQIREHLLQGKSSREVIDLGYRPGSVYGALRQMKGKDAVGCGHTDNHVSRPAGSRRKMPEWPVWHIDPPLTCPGCKQEVAHWQACPRCNCLLPLGCACTEEGSPGFGEVYSLSELRSSAGVRSLQISEASPQHA